MYLPKTKEVMNTYLKYKGWESRPPLEHMLNNVSLTLVNSHNAIGISRPYLPGIIEVGGMHIKDPKPLPKVSIYIALKWVTGVILLLVGIVNCR